jgi:dimethylhistidine N-methyltransferase
LSDHYRVLTEADLSALRSDTRDFAYEVLIGLSEKPKRLPSRFFYDDAGSELFRDIMALPEYYLTGAETEILEAGATRLIDALPGGELRVVDLGAGDGAKTMIVLRALRAAGVAFRYVPIDISEGAMRRLVATIERELPGVEIAGLVSEYTDGLHWLASTSGGGHNLVLFLGSNIGNFDRPRARAFLRRLWAALADGDRVLIGFDLKKDIDTLLAAYNDRDGVTAAFNLNLLERINRELGGNFDLDRFRHFGTYDVFSGAMKSYLVSRVEQEVSIASLATSFHFEPWEPVHTEYSYKYLRSDIRGLAASTGFEIEIELTDAHDWFVDSLWRARRPA